jgi:hypothetical protein
MMVALPALVAGAAASPAMADGHGSDDNYKPVVHVTVCKEVQKNKGYNKDEHGDHKGKNDKFKMHVSSYGYVDDAYVKVKDQECKYVDLEYNSYHKQVVVKEYGIPDGYKFDQVKCYNDYGYYKSYDNQACDFNSDWVKIVVVNKVVKKHHYDD